MIDHDAHLAADGALESRRIDPADWNPAVAAVDGPQLIVAGPGTGKTEFLVRRAAHLINSDLARPSEVVMLTFSRRAASEITRRVSARLAGEAGLPLAAVDATTFHAFAHRLLEAHDDDDLGTILTTPEQIALVADLLDTEDSERWPLPFRMALTSPGFAEEVADFLLRCRERLLGPQQLADRLDGRDDWRAIPGLFERYERRLRDESRLDYGSLLVRAIDVATKESVMAVMADRIRFVLVDEYQDTSPAQVRLLEIISGRHRNITVCGDPYQSIYSFRGSELENLADFPDRFRAVDGSKATRMVLTTSFRVPGEILDAAVRLTTGGELPGSAGPVRPAAHTGRVEAFVFDQQSAEAEWIASEVERLLIEEGFAPERIGVLVRTKRRILNEISRALDRRGVIHDKPQQRVVDHPAARIALDLASLASLIGDEENAHNHPRIDAAMRRVLLGPAIGLGVGNERELTHLRRISEATWVEIIRTRMAQHGWLAELIEDRTWAVETAAIDGFWRLWTSIPTYAVIALSEERRSDREALATFAQVLGRQKERDQTVTLADFAALSDADDFEATPLLGGELRRSGGVVVTTLHQAKGLEFDVVFIADATEGVFPDQRRNRSLLQPHLLRGNVPADGASHLKRRLQEETRLAYTAMTRATRRVTWTATAAGVDEGNQRPSRFLMAVASAIGNPTPGPPPERSGPPVSALELQAHLRRLAGDPSAAGIDRLAAIVTLAHPQRPWDPESFAGFSPPGPDTGVIQPPIHLSPSQVEAYESCPRSYVLDRRFRLNKTVSPYAEFGTLIHTVLERTERARMEGRVDSPVDQFAIATLGEAIAEHEFRSPVIRDAWRDRGERLLAGLFDAWPEESRQPVAIEHRLSITIDGVEWTGIADRIEMIGDGRLRIVDYKTSKTPPTIKEAASSLQLGFYLLAAAEDDYLAEYGVPTAAEMWYPLLIPGRWRFGFDTALLGGVKDRMRAGADGITSEDWTARISQRCGRCPVRAVCDRWPEGRDAFVE